MKLNIIIFKNVKIGCFTQPQFTDIEPEKCAVQLARSLKVNEKLDIDNQYKNLVMYEIGIFDDETGVIEHHEPRKLLDCGKIIKDRCVEDGKDFNESIPADR